MNWLDIVIVVLAMVSAFSGLSQGAARLAISFAGLIGGIFLAGRFYRDMAAAWFPPEMWAPVAAYVVILVVVWIAATMAGIVAARLIHATPFKWVDKGIGLFLGFFVGMFSCAAIVIVVAAYIPPAQGLVRGSALARFFLEHFPFLLSLLPSEFNTVRSMFA